MSDDRPPLYRIRRERSWFDGRYEGWHWVVLRWVGSRSHGFYTSLDAGNGRFVAFPTWAEAMADVDARLRR